MWALSMLIGTAILSVGIAQCIRLWFREVGREPAAEPEPGTAATETILYPGSGCAKDRARAIQRDLV